MRYPAALLLFILAGCGGPDPDSFIGAVRSGNVNRVQEHIRAGADLNGPVGVNNWTPLLHAIHKNQRGSVKTLLDAGADVNRPDPRGMTPLMMAAGYGYADIAGDLLDRGADPRRQHSDGATALDLAVVGVTDIDRFTVGDCQAGTVKVLLEKAPDLKLHSSGLDRVAIWAKKGSCAPVMQVLQQHKAL
jgi:hypothetical protein